MPQFAKRRTAIRLRIAASVPEPRDSLEFQLPSKLCRKLSRHISWAAFNADTNRCPDFSSISSYVGALGEYFGLCMQVASRMRLPDFVSTSLAFALHQTS
jgi:hypothetical protein